MADVSHQPHQFLREHIAMSFVQALNLCGLLLITIGSIAAALSGPMPQYKSDGSVCISGESDVNRRIAIHHRQKRFPFFLGLVGFGAVLQAIALFAPVCT